MSDILVMAGSVAIVLGIMVLVHEWGHFVVAKSFGVRVEIFSIGFGTRLWGWKSGDTDYRISALPLGGYVKMAGDNPLEERKGAPDEFLSKARWQRVLIALAGPAMNVVLSVILVTFVFMLGSKQQAFLDRTMDIAGVLHDSTAQKAGLAAGDHIAKVADISNPTWDQAGVKLKSTGSGHPLSLLVERGGQQIPMTVTASESMEDTFGYPHDRFVIGAVSPGTPADAAGLQDGDVIAKVNGIALANSAEFPPIVEKTQDQPLDLEVLRGASTLHLTVRPAHVTNAGTGAPAWQIGVVRTGDLVDKKLPLGSAIVESVDTNIYMAKMVAFVVVELFRGRMSLKQLQGPLGIARESGRAARRGIADLMMLMAGIGMNLAVLNLLPIPPLDGGHILFLFVEGSMRRDLSMRVKERFITVSMVFLLLIFGIVMFNDVMKIIPHH